MRKIVAVAALMTFAAGAAFAADGSMSNSKMSQSDQAMMKKCQAMSESAMKKDSNCMAMMKKNPDMMKSGMNGSGMSESKSNMSK